MLRRFCAAALFICFVHPGGSKPQPYCVKRRLIICRHKESILLRKKGDRASGG